MKPPIPSPYPEPDEPPVPSPRPIVSVTDSSGRADHWRCTLYLLMHYWPVRLALLLMVLMLTQNFFEVNQELRTPLPIKIGLSFAMALITTIVFNLLFLGLLIELGLLRSRARARVSSLTADGWHENALGKGMLLPWSSTSNVRERNGDVFVFCSLMPGSFVPMPGCYVPRSAFTSLDEGQRFYQTALRLWRGSRVAKA